MEFKIVNSSTILTVEFISSNTSTNTIQIIKYLINPKNAPAILFSKPRAIAFASLVNDFAIRFNKTTTIINVIIKDIVVI